jgi:hypothetical protein
MMSGLVRKNDGGASYGRQAAARGGYVGVEVGRIRSSRMLAAATRFSNQVQPTGRASRLR